MDSNLKLLHSELGQDLRVAASTMESAVALTDSELVMGRAGFLGIGKKVERYPLQDIQILQFVPNPSANLLTLALGAAKSELTLIFRPGQESQVEEFVRRLRARNGNAERT